MFGYVPENRTWRSLYIGYVLSKFFIIVFMEMLIDVFVVKVSNSTVALNKTNSYTDRIKLGMSSLSYRNETSIFWMRMEESSGNISDIISKIVGITLSVFM
jgi:hypothetical protein